VPSHSSWRHPAFQAAQQDRSSPTYSWYTFDDWPDNYRNFMQSSPYFPSLNTSDPGARGHLIDAAVYWLREFDVDGYRIDHVIAAGMDFWLALRRATETVKDDVVLVGEATDTPDCLRRYRGRLHGILDFRLARALRLTFGAGEWTLDQLDSFLHAYELYMADGPGTVSFLDNHDMDRFLWVAGNDAERLKMAALCQFTLGATPVLYYGTEIGMTQKEGAAQLGSGGDAEARGDMPWNQTSWDHDLLSFYRSLIRLRREEPALHGGPRQSVHLDIERKTYAYLRTPLDGRHDAPCLLVAFNLSLGNQLLHVKLPDPTNNAECLLATGSAPSISISAAALDLALAPMTAAILRV
jgi:cyclomaltodextrinase / maltogenic alpha-amylase / neopullulanase